MKLDADTIAAIATAPGRGGIGIVRLSGPQAFAIAATVSGIAAARLQPRFVQHATFRAANGEAIDEGLVLPFRAPASFTGEDVVELQGHGGPVVMDLLLSACLAQGARLARPGEFSERAFLNDKLDLAQAEAIADLIDARSAAAARGAVRSLQGVFSDCISALTEALIHLRMYVEASIDFPEEEVDFLADGQVSAMLGALESDLDTLLAQTRAATLLREGITVVIAGRPNAGKSSLLNALAGREAAIVTPIAGTTRDVLRESLAIDGIPLNLVDTAGLRDSTDPVEQEGIRRAWNEIRQADLVLLLLDSTWPEQGLPDFVHELPAAQARILVRNKCDLSGEPAGPVADGVAISAMTGAGIDDLRAAIRHAAGADGLGESPFVARRRHLDALQRARAALAGGRAQLEKHRAGELLAEDLRIAQQALGEITGEFSADELLGRIFGSFCIGK
ncbi:MAG: tRNA uridine-5-carboxymethylaminomethyl(34) synthesis GTPase MnmE [Pseudomonadota bacterium]